MSKLSVEEYKVRISALVNDRNQLKVDMMSKHGWDGKKTSPMPSEYRQKRDDINADIAKARCAISMREARIRDSAGAPPKPLGRPRKVVSDVIPKRKMAKPKRAVFQYNSAISKLRRQREVIKKQVMDRTGWNGIAKQTAPKEYAELTASITSRINHYTYQSKRVVNKNAKITAYIKKTEEFFGESLKTNRLRRNNPTLHHGCFFKYAMENKLSGLGIAKKLGFGKYVCNDAPALIRTNFTKSFGTNPRNREVYHSFKRYIEES